MHISEDRLLEYALAITEDDVDRAEVEAHLQICPSCRFRLMQVQGDINVISSIRPRRSENAPRRSSKRRDLTFRLLRSAALILFGLVAGFGAFSRLEKEPARVTPQYLLLSSQSDSLSRYAASDATDVSAGY